MPKEPVRERNEYMDSCSICGRDRSPEVKLSKIKGGWVCNNCIKRSALVFDFPDWQQRSKAIGKMTVDEMKESIERGRRIHETERMERERQAANVAEAKKAEEVAREAERDRRKNFPVTTVDLHRPYEVICPLFFQTSNKGLFGGSTYDKLAAEYREELSKQKAEGLFSPETSASQQLLEVLLEPRPVGQSSFDAAYYIAVEELKRRAFLVGADAIVGLNADFDLDTNGFQYFYLQVYGTAVRFTD